MIHKRSAALERSVNILLEGLNQFHGANLTLRSDVDQATESREYHFKSRQLAEGADLL